MDGEGAIFPQLLSLFKDGTPDIATHMVACALSDNTEKGHESDA